MSLLLIRITLVLLFMSIIPKKPVGEFEQWCIADEQTPDDTLKAAMDWACGQGGADCSKIQVNQPCFFPDTMRSHASYAFNNYFQKFKNKGGSCYFKGAAMITELDPSYMSLFLDSETNHQSSIHVTESDVNHSTFFFIPRSKCVSPATSAECSDVC